MGANIVPCQKADAAHDDQQHDDDIHQWVGGIRRQRGVQRPGTAENVKTRVAEGGNRVKDRHPYPPQAVVPAKGWQQRQGAHQFYKECPPENKPRQAHDAAHRRSGDGILHGAALLQRDIFPREHQKCYSRRNDAQSADLDQQQNNPLAKRRPIGAGVLHHQSRHADGRGGGKKRLGKRRPSPLRRRERQHQYQGAQQDNPCKA